MKSGTRALLFIVTVLLFVTSTATLGGYAQGYRIDWEHTRITKTGGFFIKAPAGSTVTIDEKPLKKVNILGTGILISNLLPREYRISVSKNGYEEWEKLLEVKAGLTTEIRNMILVRKDPIREEVSSGVVQFLMAPNKKHIVIKKQDGLWLFDTDKNGEARLTAKTFEIQGWSPDSKKLLLQEHIGTYVVYRIETGIVLPLPRNIEEPRWHAKDMNAVTFIERGGRDLVMYDLENQISRPLVPTVASYGFVDSEIVFIDERTKTMVRSSIEGGDPRQLTFTPFKDEHIAKGISFYVYGDHVFLLTSAEELIRFERETATLEHEASNVTNVTFSSLGKSLLYTTTNEMWVRYLEDVLVQPFRYKDQKELVTRLSEPIQESYWYTKDNEHIIFRLGNVVKITELDARDRRNAVDFVSLTNTYQSAETNTNNYKSLMAYNEKDDKLYFLDGNVLYRVKIK